MPTDYTQFLQHLTAAVDAIQAIPTLLTVLVVLLAVSTLTTAVVGGIIAVQLGRLVRSTTGRGSAPQQLPPAPPSPSGMYPPQAGPGVEYGPYAPRGP